MQPVILVCGVAGAGKSWICRQLKDDYHYVAHDRCWSHPTASPAEGDDVPWGPPGSKSTHLPSLIGAARSAHKTVLTEVPFGERQLKEDLEREGIVVQPVFVVEDPVVIRKRFMAREGSLPSKGVMTRLAGLQSRAQQWRVFWGTSDEVLAYLKRRCAPSAKQRMQIQRGRL
jgi:gluconate kinase